MDFDELDELDPVELPDLSTEPREFAIGIYGATGFTGCLMVEHLDALLSKQDASTRHKWAIAGRNASKLENVASRCQTRPDILHIAGEADISQMASRCRVIISAVGPYSACGEAVLAACVRQVTHYVDTTGEVPWMHDMVMKYHEQAKERGAMIVHSVGNISTPDEVLCYTLAKRLGPLKQYREYFSQYGGFSGGTLQTNVINLSGMTAEQLAVSRDPFCLGGRRDCDERAVDKDCCEVEVDPLFPSLFLAPAYNSGTGSRVVRRSCGLFEQQPEDGLEYGRTLCVVIRDCAVQRAAAEQQLQQNAPVGSAEAAAVAAGALRGSRDRGEVPWPGQGPPAATRKLYGSEIIGVAEGESGDWAHARWTSGCAYEVTAMACVAGALVLVEELDKVRPKERGGILTPAFAFHGSSWVERLVTVPFADAGEQRICLEVKDGKPSEEVLRGQVSEKNRRVMAGQAQLMKGELKGWTKPALTESSI